ncbi:MAG: N-acyl homoserine lactonase family protein [SAR324 cluster bacterium]|nr:N-acyl homoserine lactonase family protein [SAR324 cluster bacterium]
MKKFSIIAASLVATCIMGASFASAQTARGVYLMSSGTLGPFSIRVLIPSFPEDQDRDITIPIMMAVIDHPKGLVVYDSGNNIAVSDGGCKSYWAEGMCDLLQPSQTRADVIDMQLKKLGYKISDVKAYVMSHAHLDHAGNLKMFENAIIFAQQDEIYQARWQAPFQAGPAFVDADHAGTNAFNWAPLNGDYDVFGDGSVVVMDTRGHTLGTSSVYVKLKSGPLVVAGDAIWMEENLEGYPAGLNFSVQQYFASIDRLKLIRDLQGAELVMGHSANQYSSGLYNKWIR